MVEGKVLGGRYQIQDKIGVGGMAAVFRGVDNVLGRTVAIKVMLPQYATDPTFAARFRQEAQAAASLSSPYIVSIYDWGQDGDTYYIVMEYIRGTDLKSGIKSHGALAPRKVAQIGAQVCAALSVAHRHEIVHRDIKPQNIMIQPDGTAKVMDFGIARAKNSHLTQTNSVLGTAHYVSPEQTQGKELDAESDLYSLGIVMYEAACGQVPFDGDDAISVALKQVNEQPVAPSLINPKIDPEFEAIILKCMQKRPENRFHSADDLRRVLNNYIAGRPTGIAPESVYDTGEGGAETQVMTRNADATRVMTSRHAATPAYTGSYAPTTGLGGAAYQREGLYNTGEHEPQKRRIWPIIAGVVGAILVIMIVVGIMLLGGNGKLVAVPNLNGLDQAQAVEQIKKSGFDVGDVTSEYSNTAQKGQVTDQDPDAGAQRKEGTKINIVISKGAEPAKAVEVPNLKNLKTVDAEKALRDLKLVPAASEPVHSTDVEPGRVVSQDPAPGTKLVEGDTVKYSVSLGEETVSIPTVTGKTSEAASKELTNAGFTVKVAEDYSSSVPQGKVISQSPSGGAAAAKGAEITITVSKGPEQAEVPNVVGMTKDKAQSTLKAAGFKVKVVEVMNSGSGKVVQQDLKGGQTANPGSTVTISVDVGGLAPTPDFGSSGGSGEPGLNDPISHSRNSH